MSDLRTVSCAVRFASARPVVELAERQARHALDMRGPGMSLKGDGAEKGGVA